jgi:RNA polymerase sigma-70 factor, ECF subfamily
MTQIAAQFSLREIALAEEDATADRQARFSILVGNHTRFVYQIAYSVLRNVEDTEDLVQELFLKLYRSNAWEQMNHERAFLARATWRLAIDRAPKRNFRELRPDAEARQINPEQAAIASDRRERIYSMIDALPEDLRQALTLSTVEGLDSRAIAEIIGVPEGTVRTRQLRARMLLKEKLAALETKQARDTR